MKTLIFDISADFGHFRKMYTTSSPLSYSFIPPTAVYGLLSAILGLPKENNEYLQTINGQTVKLAIQIINPVKKTRVGLNWINTKGNVWIPKQRREGARTQIRTEWLKQPKFRLYVHLEDSIIHERLADYVKQHKTVYSISMGISELLADFQYVDEQILQTVSVSQIQEIVTVLPIDSICERTVEFEHGKSYFKERMPIDMNDERIVSRYDAILYETTGKSILARVSSCFLTEAGEGVVFLT